MTKPGEPGRVRRVALTGGIATGKSYCLARFAALGVPTIDADALARQALAPGAPALAAVAARFGGAVFNADGDLDRAALARVVFADPAARRDLEAIVHPQVYEEIASRFAELQNLRNDSRRHFAGCAIADVPLLYETGHERDFDLVVVAWCPPELQLARLMARDQLTPEAAAQRVASQMPIDEKRRRADIVIDTSGTMAETERQIREIYERLR